MKNHISAFLYTYKYILLFLIVSSFSLQGYAQVEIKVTPATCNGKEDGKIDVTLKGKNGPYTFLWNDGSTEDHLHDIPRGDYYLIIRDRNSCIFEKSINVGVLEDKPRVKIEGGGDRTFCSDAEDQDVELHAVTSVCAECKLKWSTGSTEEKIEVSGDGDFQVTATDSSGCFQRDSTEVKIKTEDCDDDDDDDDIDIPVVFPRDPNDILGPEGFGPQRWISVKDILPYTIRFENDPEFATAPAQKVVIRTPIDPHLNIYSFRLGSFGFGNFAFEVPPNSTYYTGRLDVKDSLEVIVDVIAGIDVLKKEAFWIFESKDPKTGNEPAAHLGFLLINDSITRRGEGYVNFTIIPDAVSSTGDTVHAVASIIFDTQEELLTPAIFNTIDAVPPLSAYKRSDVVADSSYAYFVTIKDDYGLGGSGVKNYDLYLSYDNGNSFTKYASQIPVDSTISIKGDPDKRYCAYTIARDNTGNEESKSSSDLCFSPKAKPFVRLKEPDTKQPICQGGGYAIEWNSFGIDSLDIYVSTDQGNTYNVVATNVPDKLKSFYWPLPSDIPTENDYLIKIVSSVSDTIFDIAQNHVNVIEHVPAKIFSSKGTAVCSGDTTELNVLPVYASYRWSNGINSNSFTTSVSGKYIIEVTDASGCSSKDSINFVVHSFPAQLITASTEFKFCEGKPLILKGPANMASYSWSTGESSSQITVNSIGKIALKVINEIGCTASSDTIFVEEITDAAECEALQINSGLTYLNKFIQVAPNPLTEYTIFQIYSPQSQFVNLKLFDTRGTEVAEIYKGEITGGTTVPVSYKPSEKLSNGMYIYRLLSGDGELFNGKLVIGR
ncbi:hypothetical protein MYP_3261 [Sporocytophaga myxococcoides]|uniref:Secretion system C-terminal sorting domain-containing protein n=1 Tax=Sporocytophaga myxococcoides TaxID=153721 RepID=A0A098LHX7_9BACT|nr:T9SS type A sorting domain-containing protein [Sporocytophaga myxococcoides]GAL86032.1 hypothetical protein MYP_3261 [Sporocytophaga myxococcoides]